MHPSTRIRWTQAESISDEEAAVDGIGSRLFLTSREFALRQSHPLDGLLFNTDAMMRGMTRSLRLAGVTDNQLCAVYALHHPAGECPGVWLP